MNLTDAHVLITGASRGIGAAMARDFHAAGARVSLVARSADGLAEVAAPLGGHVVAADLGVAESLATVVSRAEEGMGPVDVLVNNAGIDEAGAVWEAEFDGLRRLVNLNVLAVMELTRQVLPGMIERGRGHVVFISSMASVGAMPGLAAYSATKAAVSHFASGLVNDLKGLPIGVTTVQPGFVEPTDMMDQIMTYPPAKAARERFVKLGLLPDTDRDELAQAVVRAVQADRRLLVRPRRARGLAGMVEMPRKMTARILAGVPPRRG